MIETKRTYVCKRARLCRFLKDRGFMPYKITPDRNNPAFDVFLFDATPELYKVVMEYYNTNKNDERFTKGSIEEDGRTKESV